MTKILLLFSAICVLTLFTGCNKNYYDRPEYADTWYSGTGGIDVLVLGTNNTYTLSLSTALVSSGTYTATKTALNFISTSGNCSDSVAASYTYTYSIVSINGTFTRHLNLVPISDSCSERAAVLTGDYSTKE